MAAPPLPPGFTLDQPVAAKAPPLPEGFVLDQPTAAPSPAAQPFDPTGLAMPASAGYEQPAPTPTAPPVNPNRQLSLDLTAADKGLVADTLGAPVDLTTAGLNSGSWLTNVVAPRRYGR